jgi:hypothetical protein
MSIAIGGIFLTNRYKLVQIKLLNIARNRPASLEISSNTKIAIYRKRNPIKDVRQIAIYIFWVLRGKLFLRLSQTILPFLKVALLHLAKNIGATHLAISKAKNAAKRSLNANPKTAVIVITMAHDLRTFFWSSSSFLYLRIKLVFITVTLYSKNYTINTRSMEVVNQDFRENCYV